MISPNDVGVAGHSEGAITTLGFFNTCCRDPRVKAAAAFSGDPEPYPGGHYVFDGQPPMLVVHGTKDGFLPYGQIVSVFNKQQGPKVLLSLIGSNHGNWIQPRSRWFTSVARTSTDFFRRYLDGSEQAGATHRSRCPAGRDGRSLRPEARSVNDRHAATHAAYTPTRLPHAIKEPREWTDGHRAMDGLSAWKRHQTSSNAPERPRPIVTLRRHEYWFLTRMGLVRRSCASLKVRSALACADHRVRRVPST